MGRILAVDWGDKRIGLAATDALRMIASPVGTITRRVGKRPPVAELLRQAEALGDVDLVVMGLPLDGDGEETPRCAEVREVAAKVTERSGLPVAFVDERFTTAKALRTIQEMGGSTRGRKEDVDALAATVLLQHAMAMGVTAPGGTSAADGGDVLA
ncbi:MAG: Holliday junction resolvase RuvX [Gemmatimonadaceae bacterium]|jgi:putative Holliday junction resolvase|nr:Holliday junction resolvase RuvX [Gemmatimonadaceae bacterium]